MEFDPESGGLKCRFCGHAEALPAPATTAMASHAFEQALAEVEKLHAQMSEKALEVTCQGCGSVVNFEPPEVAGACLFCGAAIVAQTKTADPLIAPDGLLPAKVPKSTAQAEVQRWLSTRWLSTRWFAPNSLKGS
jgi:ribosomal protein S27E